MQTITLYLVDSVYTTHALAYVYATVNASELYATLLLGQA